MAYDFIDELLKQQGVSTSPFGPISALAQQNNFGQPPPVAAPVEQPSFMSKVGGAFNKADGFLDSGGGQFLVNLLAQQGYSTMPGSPLGAVGRAGLMTRNQRERTKELESRQALTDSQIERNKAAASQGSNPQGGNVQTTFKGANGNMWTITRDNQATDTGVPFNENLELIEAADGRKEWWDRSTGTKVGDAISSKQAAEDQENAARNAERVSASLSLPEDLAGIDSTLTKVDSTIENVNDAIGRTSPSTTGLPGAITAGIPGTKSKALRSSIKTIQANLGFDQLTAMRNASKTGGALGQVSERELELLISAVESLDPELDDQTLKTNLESVVRHYENYKRELQKMQDIMRTKAGETTENTPTVIDFNELP